MLARLAADQPWLTVLEVDIETDGDLADEFGVRSIQALLLFQDGRCIDRLIGKVPYVSAPTPGHEPQTTVTAHEAVPAVPLLSYS